MCSHFKFPFAGTTKAVTPSVQTKKSSAEERFITPKISSLDNLAEVIQFYHLLK